METVKKITAGVYHYNGFVIENMQSHRDDNVTSWNITRIGEYESSDAANTLRDAKQLIDRCY